MKPFTVFFILSIFSLQAAAQFNIVVAKDGSGDYTTLKAAITAAPTTGTALNPYVIFVKNGFYYEKDTVPANKPFIQIVGESISKTVIVFDAAAGNVPPSGVGTYGTSGSATLTINASDFTAMNITFSNSFNYDSAAAAGFSGSQAVAVLINADRVAFKNCRFMGNQDTLYTKGSFNARQYFKGCYIDGLVDFIFGSSVAVFDSCVIYPKTKQSSAASYITAANTSSGQTFGYVFRDCKIPANPGPTMYSLGRPWNNATSGVTAHNRVAYLNTSMGASVDPVGWSIWDAGTITDSITDVEYKSKNFDGSLKDVSSRISWSHQLTDAEAIDYNLANILGGWDPCSVNSNFCSYQDPGIVVSNFKGTKGASLSTFTWNISWAMTGIKYDLYRATTSGGGFTQIGTVTAGNDTSINFSLTDPLPPAGNVYYYYIVASKAGYAPDTTNTVLISTAPTITVLGTLGSFIQSLTPPAPSVTQSYTVSGTNLVDVITITPPANFEVSADGITWFTSTTPLVLSPSGGNVSATTIQVRLNASVAGTSSGDIIHSTTGSGATNVPIAVTGNTTTDVLLTYIVLQLWPLDVDDADSAAVRSAFVLPNRPVLNKLYLSNGTQVPGIPAYSGTHGQAFGASSNGDGSWGTGIGGPGGTLNRTFYEQFVIKTAPNKSVRVDSFIINVVQHNTANGKMAIAFSKTGFVSDSTELVAFPSGTALPNQTSGTANILRYALNGADGLTIAAGDSLAVRLYFAAGTSNAGRYAKLKSVYFKGVEIGGTTPLKLLSFSNIYENKKVKLFWTTANEINAKAFLVESSTTGDNFTVIGTVTANNMLSESNYSFVDNRSLRGNIYYRLRMVDDNGMFIYSKVLTINISGKQSISFYPNPVTDILHITHPAATKNTRLNIYSADGKLITSRQMVLGALRSDIDFHCKNGLYILTVESDELHEVVKFIKK